MWDSSVGAWLAQGSTNNVGDQIAGLQAKFPVSAADGGTGRTTLTSGSYLKGNGTSAVTLQAVPIPIADGGTNATTLAGAQDNLRIGLAPVSPSSVSNAGGSVTTETLGTVNFSTVTSLSLNGVFTSSYANYSILITNVYRSAVSDIFLRLRSGSTDASTNTYYALYLRALGTALAVDAQGGESFLYAGIGGPPYAGNDASKIEVFNPANGSHKTAFQVVMYGIPSSQVFKTGGGFHDISAAYDGLTIYTSAGNMSGRIQVFGYNS